MRNTKKILITLIIGIFVISSMGCKMVKKTDKAVKNSPVAKVDGEKITKEQLDERMKPLTAQYDQQYGPGWESNSQAKSSFDEEKKQTRDNMVDELLILQHAKKAKVMPTDKEINDAFKTQYDSVVKQQSQGNEKDFITLLKQYGYTKDSYTKSLKQQIKVSKAMDGILKDVKVTDEEIQKEYDTNKNIKYTKEPNKMDISHILVASEDDAKKAIDRINKGEKFEDVAKAVSTDGSKDKGGELGSYCYDQSQNPQPLDTDFFNAAMQVQVGQISAPVKTQFGWHVIKINSRDVFDPKPLSDVKSQINDALLKTKKQSVITADLEKWKKSLGKKIKNYNKNL